MGKKKAVEVKRHNEIIGFAWAKRQTVKHAADCVRIQSELNKLGYTPTLADCSELWSAYSKTQEGSPEWLPLPDALQSKLVHNVLPEVAGVGRVDAGSK
jgi:hypothetical protein